MDGWMHACANSPVGDAQPEGENEKEGGGTTWMHAMREHRTIMSSSADPLQWIGQ